MGECLPKGQLAVEPAAVQPLVALTQPVRSTIRLTHEPPCQTDSWPTACWKKKNIGRVGRASPNAKQKLTQINQRHQLTPHPEMENPHHFHFPQLTHRSNHKETRNLQNVKFQVFTQPVSNFHRCSIALHHQLSPIPYRPLRAYYEITLLFADFLPR